MKQKILTNQPTNQPTKQLARYSDIFKETFSKEELLLRYTLNFSQRKANQTLTTDQIRRVAKYHLIVLCSTRQTISYYIIIMEPSWLGL